MSQATTTCVEDVGANDLGTARDVVPRRVISPRITRLLSDLALADPAHRRRLTDAFWADVDSDGSPLIEAGQPGHRDVTFVWRGSETTTAVLVSFSGLPRATPETGRLTWIEGTDIWYASFRLRSDHRSGYRLIPFGPDAVDNSGKLNRIKDFDLRRRKLSGQSDPFNSYRLPGRWGQPESSVFALPDAPADPWTAPYGRTPRIGTAVRHRVESNRLGGERDVWGYRPPAAEQGVELPVLVLCDGDRWFGELELQHVLDEAIDAGTLPSLTVLAPDAVDLDTRWQELSAYDPFVSFLADELLPWAGGRWSISADPTRTVIAGQSLGGLTALYATLTRPDRFGTVLAQSASLWWKPGLPTGRPQAADPRHCWLADQFAAAERLPSAVQLQAGLLEGDLLADGQCSMVLWARQLRRVLDGRGVSTSSYEFVGGHDYACWRSGLITGLAELLS